MRQVLAAVVALVLAAEPAWADDYTGTISVFEVDHLSGDKLTMHDVINREKPYIRIFSVDPPVSDCGEANCWPLVSFFILNPKWGSGQDITVECRALSGDGRLLAIASVTPQMPPLHASDSSVSLRSSQYAQFAKVICSVTRVVPNDIVR